MNVLLNDVTIDTYIPTANFFLLILDLDFVVPMIKHLTLGR